MVRIAGALLVLNLLDGVLTWLGLKLGVVTEGNPLLGWAWSVSPAAVGVYKLAGVSVLILTLAAARGTRWSRAAGKCLVVAYVVVISLHMRWLTLLYLGNANFFQR